MEPLEEHTHSFIVKIWRERSGRAFTWRGHITHVPDGTRRPLRRLGQIGDFIRPYLAQMGVRPRSALRLRAGAIGRVLRSSLAQKGVSSRWHALLRALRAGRK